MIAPEQPLNEAERVAKLHSLDILDTPAEERFDRLTRLAKRVFDVPTALVSLVDAERQWFKSGDRFAGTQTARRDSFCGHTILGYDLLIVPDTLADARFRDNPLVIGGPRIRFYAGCPLTVPGGFNLGALCVIDQRPRTFDDDDRRSLRDLAKLAVRELVAVELATTDELTGCLNRRAFTSMARQLLGVCRRTGQGVTLAYFDLDGFKHINDTYGHAQGDRALIEFVSTLRASIRDADLVGRLGGDEFAALFVGIDEASGADLIARVRDELDRRHDAGTRPYRLRFSVGEVGFAPQRHHSIEQMLDEADAIMYAEKHGLEHALAMR